MNNIPVNNNMITAFMNFKNQIQGDPKQQVINLLQSGKMSNQQFQQLQEQAKQFGHMLGMK